MKNWIRKKLGIPNHVHEMSKLGEEAVKGFAAAVKEMESANKERFKTCDDAADALSYTLQAFKEYPGQSGHVHDVRNQENETVIIPMLESFEEQVWKQQEKVKRSGKYPDPIHKKNHTMSEWLKHQAEELADTHVYHECMKQTTEDIKTELEKIRAVLEGERTAKEEFIYDRITKALDRI